MLIIGFTAIIFILMLAILLLFWYMRPNVLNQQHENFTRVYALMDAFLDSEITRYKDTVVLKDKLIGNVALNPREYDRVINDTIRYALESVPTFVINEMSLFMSIEEIQDMTAKKVNDFYKGEYLASEMETLEEFEGKGEDR